MSYPLISMSVTAIFPRNGNTCILLEKDFSPAKRKLKVKKLLVMSFGYL